MPIYRVDEPIGGRVDLNNGYSIPLIGLNMAEFRSTDSIYCAIDVALAAGYRLIDTAKCYGNEAVIGDALQVILLSN
jgi:diketogulonate reductase-like aldo/keto reductase